MQISIASAEKIEYKKGCVEKKTEPRVLREEGGRGLVSSRNRVMISKSKPAHSWGGSSIWETKRDPDWAGIKSVLTFRVNWGRVQQTARARLRNDNRWRLTIRHKPTTRATVLRHDVITHFAFSIEYSGKVRVMRCTVAFISVLLFCVLSLIVFKSSDRLWAYLLPVFVCCSVCFARYVCHTSFIWFHDLRECNYILGNSGYIK